MMIMTTIELAIIATRIQILAVMILTINKDGSRNKSNNSGHANNNNNNIKGQNAICLYVYRYTHTDIQKYIYIYMYIISYETIFGFFISLDPGRRKFVLADGHRPRLSTMPLDCDVAFGCWCPRHSSGLVVQRAYSLGWRGGGGGVKHC